MKESTLIPKLRDVVLGATPAGTAVRTPGGDEDRALPEVIMSFDARRSRDNGSNPFAGFNYDSLGNLVSRTTHYYFQGTLDLEFKSESELSAYDMGDDVQRAFMLYEDSPLKFSPDVFLWEVGEVRPQRNPVMEPDWYELTCRIRFRYLKTGTDTDVTTLNDIQHDINSY